LFKDGPHLHLFELTPEKQSRKIGLSISWSACCYSQLHIAPAERKTEERKRGKKNYMPLNTREQDRNLVKFQFKNNNQIDAYIYIYTE
jgi:hypothetical protein